MNWTRFPDGATIAGRVRPEDLTAEERLQVRRGGLGYCEGHWVLYQKYALDSCPIPFVLEDGTPCREWPAHE